MIWFACKQCGKVHGRSESSVGSMIFCGCGQGLTVPWESTAPEPAPDAPGPVLAPVQFDAPTDEDRPRRLIIPPPLPERKPRRTGPRDPNACLNHEDRPKTANCPDCGEGFCSSCLVAFRGQTLCGPCKNLRVRALARPPQVSGWALGSFAAALIALFLAAFLFPPGGSLGRMLVWNLVCLIPPALASFFAVLALRRMASDRRLSGDGLALVGLTLAGFVVIALVFLNLYGTRLS